MFIRLVLLALWLQSSASYMMFQAKIPNGNKVPLPCKTDKLWPGVGHLVVDGTGTRNPFGQDFEAEGKEWTKDLCRKDSDGDGLTNGAELGDPDCTWSPGQTPKRTTGISHPGVCEPWDNPSCMKRPLTGSKYPTQKDWLNDICISDGLNCSAVNETGMLQLQVRLKANTSVDPQETTYMCQMFNVYDLGVPRNKSFHMVAVTPIIDNRNVLHHMVLSGCKDDVVQRVGPFECGMLADDRCQSFLHVWTVGLPGECLHPQCGFKIGEGGYTIIALQLHWNNPELRSDFTDSSGLTLYYTPNLRQFNAGVLMVGTQGFWLPPQKPHITAESTCSSACTSKTFKGDLNVFSAWNHMHYAGYTMSIKKISQNQEVTYLTNDPVYSYDSPQVQLYPDTLALKPGDALVTTCGFNTMNRNKTTPWGEATKEEMCFGFISYFPVENMPQPFCIDYNGISQCDAASHHGCQIDRFIADITTNSSALFKEVQENCKFFWPCLDECVATFTKHMKSNTCLQGNVWEYIQDMLRYRTSKEAIEFMGYVSSCKAEVYLALNPMETTKTVTTATRIIDNNASATTAKTNNDNNAAATPATRIIDNNAAATSATTNNDNNAAATSNISVLIICLALMTSNSWR